MNNVKQQNRNNIPKDFTVCCYPGLNDPTVLYCCFLGKSRGSSLRCDVLGEISVPPFLHRWKNKTHNIYKNRVCSANCRSHVELQFQELKYYQKGTCFIQSHFPLQGLIIRIITKMWSLVLLKNCFRWKKKLSSNSFWWNFPGLVSVFPKQAASESNTCPAQNITEESFEFFWTFRLIWLILLAIKKKKNQKPNHPLKLEKTCFPHLFPA